MISSILEPLKDLGLCSPNAHLIASKTLDLPHPFGPTTTVIPDSNLREVFSGNDLKPNMTNSFKYIITFY